MELSQNRRIMRVFAQFLIQVAISIAGAPKTTLSRTAMQSEAKTRVNGHRVSDRSCEQ
jgi:hypothetical protein